MGVNDVLWFSLQLRTAWSGFSKTLRGLNMKMTDPNIILSAAFLSLLLVCFAVIAQDSAGSEVLTNDKVITMVKASLPPSVIVNKIHTSKTNFNTNTNELIRL